MNIIGLGKAGCAIADGFSQYPQYNIYKIDTDLDDDFDFIEKYEETKTIKKSYKIKTQPDPEAYEANVPSLKTFFAGIKGKTYFIVGGSGDISAMSLRIMEQIKDRCDIEVIYLCPDSLLLNESNRMHEKVTYNVLQEYARSRAINRILLVSNTNLEKILGDVPILGYYKKLNELLVSTTHMINVFKNSNPVLAGLQELAEDSTKRIYTVGIFNIEKNEEKLFFPLDNIREKGYIYSISKERLQTEGDLHKTITFQMKEKSQDENVNVSFGIFSTDYKTDYGYVLAYSPNIQS